MTMQGHREFHAVIGEGCFNACILPLYPLATLVGGVCLLPVESYHLYVHFLKML